MSTNEKAIDILHEVLCKRERQRKYHGFDATHDDKYKDDEFVRAAICYLIIGSKNKDTGKVNTADEVYESMVNPNSLDETNIWPWDLKWWRPKDKRSNYIKAISLLVAEVERMDRENEPSSKDNN